MTFKHKILMLSMATALPLVSMSAQAAEEIVSKKTTMSDGTEVTVTQKTDVNAAADSMTVKYTTYSYDTNHNGVIENDEVVSYVTRYADANNDGYIDATEYDRDSMTYFADMISKNNTEATSYTYWDKDKDNRLDSSEIDTLVKNAGIYKTWDYDADGKIEASEFSKATFNAYDDNHDGMISMEEWKDVIM